jgi:PAS domain S-box-containing protein
MSYFHTPTAFQLAGIVVLVMPAFTWWALSRSPSMKLGLWCVSGILIGVGSILFGLRLQIPNWASYPLANFLVVLGTLVRIQSLRYEVGKPWPGIWVVLGAIVSIVIFEYIRVVIDDIVMRLVYMHLLLLLLFGYITFIAWQIGARFQNRSAKVIAGFHGLLVAGFLLRLSEVTFSAINTDMMATTYGGILIAVAGLLTGAVSHMAYVGMQLEQTQVKLITVEDEYKGILNTTPDGFVLANAAGRCIDVNEIYCRMLGYARDELLRMMVWEIKENSDTETNPEMLYRIREKGFDRHEERHRCRDGRLLDVEVSVTYMPAPADKFVFLVRDISERKKAHIELERRVFARTAELATARAEAESANAVKTRFMSNVSHEMRTPIHGILGFAKIGKGKVGNSTPEKLRVYFEKIEQSGERLQHLIESLLNLAQATWTEYSAVAAENVRQLSPSELTFQCCSVMEGAAQKRQQNIVIENCSSLSVIYGDEALLHQVLEHLIGNALRYSPEQSTIIVKLQDRSAPMPVTLSSGNGLSIQVIDEGCGIPEKELTAIFEPFYESSRTATGAGGRGLGLSLCRAIIDRHKGKLTAANRPEGGAIFEVILPAG